MPDAPFFDYCCMTEKLLAHEANFLVGGSR